MAVHTIDPLRDPRWPSFLERHQGASAFHAIGWLDALRRTYQYEPVAYTTSPPGGEITNAVLFCRVKSWLTGRRLVSLPFSDHCQPLTDTDEELCGILRAVAADADREGCRYVELRPVVAPGALAPSEEPGAASGQTNASLGFGPSDRFYLNFLDLRPDPERLYAAFHKSCIQRNIRRAEREQLVFETGSSPEILEKWYGLMTLTRRRHRLPPQPRAWFRNLAQCLGDALRIHVALKDTTPVAAVLSLLHKRSLVYKYGCADERYFNLGGTAAVFWEMIREGKARGAETLDMGRSAVDTPGLYQFKDRWGSVRSELVYYRNPPPRPAADSRKGWTMALAQRVFGKLPDPVLALVGKMLYRHTG